MLSDLRRLRALRAVGTLGSFSAAADALGYTQSAVSQQIAALEAEVGLTLVERTRPPRLSEAGAVLADAAAPVFEHLATAEARLDALRGVRAGRLRLAAFGSALSTFLAPAVARFRRAHPGVAVQLVERLDGIPLLRAGEVDLAVVFDPPPDGGLDLTHVLDDELLVVLPAGHRLARRRAVPVAALADEDWITPSPAGPAAAYWRTLGALAGRAGFAPRVVHELDSLAATQAFVAAGQGIALMHRLTLPAEPHPGLATRPLAGERPARRVCAATVSGRRWPPADAMVAILGQWS